MTINELDQAVRKGRQKRIEACDKAHCVKHQLWVVLDRITWGECFMLGVKYKRGDLDVVQ
jgi:hypothetical protein